MELVLRYFSAVFECKSTLNVSGTSSSSCWERCSTKDVTMAEVPHFNGGRWWDTSAAAFVLLSQRTGVKNTGLIFVLGLMRWVIIKNEELWSLAPLWLWGKGKLWWKWVQSWPRIGHFIKRTSPVDVLRCIAVRRYFLQADRLLRVSDVEGFKGPDRLLHSACILRLLKPAVISLFSMYSTGSVGCQLKPQYTSIYSPH